MSKVYSQMKCTVCTDILDRIHAIHQASRRSQRNYAAELIISFQFASKLMYKYAENDRLYSLAHKFWAFCGKRLQNLENTAWCGTNGFVIAK